MSLPDALYSKLPLRLQNAAVSFYGVYWKWLRFGGDFQNYVRSYVTRDRFTTEQWTEYQSNKLRDILRICVSHVPYYSREWSDDQKESAQSGNLISLPLLEKEPLRANPHDFVRIDKKE